ncbi:unnamed protein product [Caenorhabditis brenneri]
MEPLAQSSHFFSLFLIFYLVTMKRFSGKTVIITGSSNGIGRTAAVLFAKQGAQVTITGRDAERLQTTRRQILRIKGVYEEDVNVVVANLTESKGQDEIIRSTLDKFGKIDILVNNAGANVTDGTMNTDQSMDLYHKTFQINFQAVTKGEIVNVSSVAGEGQALSGTPYYSASKAALNQYTRCVAIDLIQYGVRVNSVSPGVVSTGFLGAMGMADPIKEKLESFLASKKDCIPAGACGKPNDIAEIILFLADRKRSSYIIGHSIIADGGGTCSVLINSLFIYIVHDDKKIKLGDYRFLLIFFALYNFTSTAVDLLVPSCVLDYNYGFSFFIVDGVFEKKSTLGTLFISFRCCIVSAAYCILHCHFVYRYMLLFWTVLQAAYVFANADEERRNYMAPKFRETFGQDIHELNIMMLRLK